MKPCDKKKKNASKLFRIKNVFVKISVIKKVKRSNRIEENQLSKRNRFLKKI